MSEENASILDAWFESYVARFRQNGGLHAMHQLKYEHSLRVRDNAVIIARRGGWSEDDVAWSATAALLHDVGRFTQFAEFGTFADGRSFNHARRGGVVLEKEARLCHLPASERTALLDAVSFHNCHVMPESLPERSFAWLKLVRDADKLDIFYVLDDAVRQNKLSLYPEIVLHVDVNGPPSEDVIGSVRHRRPVEYSMIRSLADFFLTQLAWIHDINYAAALDLIAEREIITRISDHLPKSEAVLELVADAQDYLMRRRATEPATGN